MLLWQGEVLRLEPLESQMSVLANLDRPTLRVFVPCGHRLPTVKADVNRASTSSKLLKIEGGPAIVLEARKRDPATMTIDKTGKFWVGHRGVVRASC